MSPIQPKHRPEVNGGANVQERPSVHSALATSRVHSTDARHSQVPAGRDAFPYVVAALVGLMLIGLSVAAFLLNSINSTPQAKASSSVGVTSPGSDLSSAASPVIGGRSLPGTAMPTEGQEHILEGRIATYKNYPPSSGAHYVSTADYGFSGNEIPEEKLVHNLEHGAIVLYYRPDLPGVVLQSLRDTATKLPTEKYGKIKIVVVPYPALQTALAITAWGRIETLESFDYDKLRAFYVALVDQGPEDVP